MVFVVIFLNVVIAMLSLLIILLLFFAGLTDRKRLLDNADDGFVKGCILDDGLGYGMSKEET